jgi:tripartite-type tricarboxylate transporter receptor subunit TctC
VTARFRELGAYPRPTTPAELDAFVAADRSKWLAVIDRLGLKPE